MFSSEVRKQKKKGTVGLKRRFNRCRRARQRRINIQRGMHKPWQRAVEWVQPGLCVCEVLADRVCQRSPWEIYKTAGRCSDYCLTPTEQLATSFRSRPHTRWRRKGVRAHEYSRPSWGGKEKPKSAERESQHEWRPSEGTQSGAGIQTPFSLLALSVEQAKPNSWKDAEDRGKKEGGGGIESVLGRNQFQHESDTASRHISSDIDWRGCAYEYSTENCPSWNACTGRLQMWENSPPTSEISRLYCLSCHADIKGNFLCLCCLRQSLLFSVTKCHLFFLFNLQNIQKISQKGCGQL